MEMKEKKIDGTLIYDGKVIHVVKDKVLCPNGCESVREIVKHNGGAAVLCLNDKEEVLLEKQYRYAYNEIIYEIPAGKLELNENSDHPDVDSMIKAISDGNYVGVSSKVKNILEPVTASEYPEIKEIEQMLRENGADCAAMSGSGPTVFGLFTDREVAQKAFFKFKEDGKYARNVFLTGYKYNINL